MRNIHHFLLLCGNRSFSSFSSCRGRTVRISSRHEPLKLLSVSVILNDRTLNGGRNGNDSALDRIDDMNSQIILNIKNRNKVFLKDVTTMIDLVEETNSANSQRALLLLTCCTRLLVEQTPKERMNLAHRCWEMLKTRLSFNVNHYNAMIQCYIDNDEKIIAGSFLQAMVDKPNAMTYKLLLKAVCKHGDVNQAIELMANMKTASIKIDENIQHYLIEGYGKLKDMKSVRKLSDQISVGNMLTSDMACVLIKAYLYNDLSDETFDLLSSCRSQNIAFTEQQIFEILETAIGQNNDELYTAILQLLPEKTVSNPIISPYMQSMCSILAYKGHPELAFKIYKSLPPPTLHETEDENSYCRMFIRDCVKADVPADVIIKICTDLMNSQRNRYALFVACEAALHFYKENTIFKLFNKLKEDNQPIRNHYFWPLFVRSFKERGEDGILNVIEQMKKLNLRIEEETVNDYILPYLDLENPIKCIKQLQNYGVTASTTVVPVLINLLKENSWDNVKEVCAQYNVKIHSKNLLVPLINSYILVKNTPALLNVLKYIQLHDSEGSEVFLGDFLLTFLRKERSIGTIKNFDHIVQEFLINNFKISEIHAVSCKKQLSTFPLNSELSEKIVGKLNAITNENHKAIDDPSSNSSADVSQLLLHLKELERKNMNTRGQLRKLLLTLLKEGNIYEMNLIIKKIHDQQMPLSDGMKASIMDFYVKQKDLENARKYMAELLQSPNFKIDGHKMLDYVTLLAENGQLVDAVDNLKNNSAHCLLKGGKSLTGNAVRLLNAVSLHNDIEIVENIVHLLIRYRYCSVSNVILGPVIKMLLDKNDIKGAFKMFIKYCMTYNKTPMKYELLLALMQKVYNSNETTTNNYKDMLQDIFNLISKIHGEKDAQISMILTLSELGCEDVLLNNLRSISSTIDTEILMKECKRVASQHKSDTLITLAKIVQKHSEIKNINPMELYQLAMNVYRDTEDYKSALKLWSYLSQSGQQPSKEVFETIVSIMNKNNLEIPAEIKKYKVVI